jgi:hypothetical protein
VSVRLTPQQLRGTFPDSTGVFSAHVPPVVQEELKQCHVVLPQRPPQEEVGSQPCALVEVNRWGRALYDYGPFLLSHARIKIFVRRTIR